MTPEEKRAHEKEQSQRRAELAAAQEQARIDRARQHAEKMQKLREEQQKKDDDK